MQSGYVCAYKCGAATSVLLPSVLFLFLSVFMNFVEEQGRLGRLRFCCSLVWLGDMVGSIFQCLQYVCMCNSNLVTIATRVEEVLNQRFRI